MPSLSRSPGGGQPFFFRSARRRRPRRGRRRPRRGCRRGPRSPGRRTAVLRGIRAADAARCAGTRRPRRRCRRRPGPARAASPRASRRPSPPRGTRGVPTPRVKPGPRRARPRSRPRSGSAPPRQGFQVGRALLDVGDRDRAGDLGADLQASLVRRRAAAPTPAPQCTVIPCSTLANCLVDPEPRPRGERPHRAIRSGRRG